MHPLHPIKDADLDPMTTEVAEADAFLGYPSIVQRQDLRGAANLTRIIGHHAPNLTDRERDECERIATRLTEIAIGGQ